MTKLLAYLQLLRIPNVFTAMADVLMGFLISHGSLAPWPECLLLLLASSSIYLAGMVLNDWFDIEVDRVERPERPLPSGRIARSHALIVGVALLVLGALAALLASIMSEVAASLNVALLLIGAVVLYDGLLKKTPLGPANMGLCRALNVLLGMSTMPGAIWVFEMGAATGWRFGTIVAAGVGLYIMGVTRFARREATPGARLDLTSSMMGFNLGLLLVAIVAGSLGGLSALFAKEHDPYWLRADTESSTVRLVSAGVIWAAVVLLTNFMVWRAVDDGQPRAIQRAVKTCIVSLIGLDAAVVALVNGPIWACAVLALLLPTLVLGRWVYST